MEDSDIGVDRRHQYDRVLRLGKRVVDDVPILAVGQDIGADQAPNRLKRVSLLRRQQTGMDGRACGVHQAYRAILHRLVEARRTARFAQRNGARFHRRDEAGTNELIDLESAGRNADKMQVAGAVLDDRLRHRHRYTRIINRKRELRARLDPACHRLQLTQQFRLPTKSK